MYNYLWVWIMSLSLYVLIILGLRIFADILTWGRNAVWLFFFFKTNNKYRVVWCAFSFTGFFCFGAFYDKVLMRQPQGPYAPFFLFPVVLGYKLTKFLFLYLFFLQKNTFCPPKWKKTKTWNSFSRVREISNVVCRQAYDPLILGEPISCVIPKTLG